MIEIKDNDRQDNQQQNEDNEEETIEQEQINSHIQQNQQSHTIQPDHLFSDPKNIQNNPHQQKQQSKTHHKNQKDNNQGADNQDTDKNQQNSDQRMHQTEEEVESKISHVPIVSTQVQKSNNKVSQTQNQQYSIQKAEIIMKQKMQKELQKQGNPQNTSQYRLIRIVNEFFYNLLPNNTEITKGSVFGQCKLQIQRGFGGNGKKKSSVNEVEFFNNNQYKMYRYLTTPKQLIFIRKIKKVKSIFPFTPHVNKNENISIIPYTCIIDIVQAVYSANLLLICRFKENVYENEYRHKNLRSKQFQRPNQNENFIESKPYSVMIQITDVDEMARLSTLLMKAISVTNQTNQSNPARKFIRAVTLLGMEQFRWRELGNLDEEGPKSEGEELIVRAEKIKEISFVNLNRMRKQINNTTKVVDGPVDLKSMFEVIGIAKKVQTPSLLENASNTYFIKNKKKSFPSASTSSNNSSYVIKVFSLPLTPTIAKLLHSYIRLHKQQELITPYIPQILKSMTIQIPPLLILEYNNYGGKEITELIKTKKVGLGDSNKFKVLIGEMATAIGHVHECGHIAGEAIPAAIINYDGHVLLPHMEGIKKIEEGSQNKGFVEDWKIFGQFIYNITVNSTENSQKQPISQNTARQILPRTTQPNLYTLAHVLNKQPELLSLIKSLLNPNASLRLGSINDYHAVLDSPYFKGVDKRKLMKREGQGIYMNKIQKIIESKSKEQMKIEGIENGQKTEDRQMGDLDVQNIMKECIFDHTLDFC